MDTMLTYYSYLTAHSFENPESSVGRQGNASVRYKHKAGTLIPITPGATILKANIDDTRQMVADLRLSKLLQIGNSDAGSFFSKEVLEDVDYGVRLCFLAHVIIHHADT